jgi:hypothetical protein
LGRLFTLDGARACCQRSFVTHKSLIPDDIADGRSFAQPPTSARGRQTGAESVRIAMAAWLTLALLLAGISIGRAYDRDETALTVRVTSADHELAEGYFSLGESATLMVKPGSDLYRFLARQRGHRIKVVLQESAAPELSRLER